MQASQVFVSHTSDMARLPGDHSFVRAALDAVAKAKHVPADMQYFAARDSAPADYCRARVQECDIYVAIVGFRYGSLVPGTDVSYTELEFQAASAAGLPRLVFLLDKSIGEMDGWADADQGPVSGFRRRLSEAGLIVRSFTSPADLELEVLHALYELEPDHGAAVRRYLEKLAAWINTDPWPRDRRFGGPVLTPASIERRLRVFVPGREGDEELEADDLIRLCRRLVLLGGPGSGKTWLAKRAARRCAEQALAALQAGASLDDVEIPLYTTCAKLFAASGSIREAALSSALNQLDDLGDPAVNAAVRQHLTGRSAPVLLIIDSLDEAHGSHERLRQADTLPWRIILTTRPSMWNQQLALDDMDSAHRIGELQPLRYPEDVHPFIRSWFAYEPGRGQRLVRQIAGHAGFQQAATVPLVLAFYCIVGGHEPLPESRRELYSRVISRLLTGRWRGELDQQPDVSACLEALRAWAWPGPEGQHPVSGVGTWKDDILAPGAKLDAISQRAADHVAMPLGPADIDTGETPRRYIHRTIREHLVAEFAARLPVGDALEALLPHLWYDADWEYSAPAAIAMHPERSRLLHDLMCRAAGSSQLPDISDIDAGWNLRELLCRIVPESSESDWSSQVVSVITTARTGLARAGRIEMLTGSGQWPESDRQVRLALVQLLADPAYGWAAGNIVDAIVRLTVTPEDQRHACGALLALLEGTGQEGDSATVRLVSKVVDGLVQLAGTPADRRQARTVLLRMLAGQPDGWVACLLAAGIGQLSPTARDRQLARDALLALIPRHSNDGDVLWMIASTGRAPAPEPGESTGRTGQDRIAVDSSDHHGSMLEALAAEGDGRTAAGLAAALAQSSLTGTQKAQIRGNLLTLLPRQTDSRTAAEIAGLVSRFSPSAKESDRARAALLGLLSADLSAGQATWLADALIQAGPTPPEQQMLCGVLLRLLAGQADGRLAARLAIRVSRLSPGVREQRRARRALLRSMAGEPDDRTVLRLASCLLALNPSVQDRRTARAILLGLLASQGSAGLARQLAGIMARLAVTTEDRREASSALLGLVSRPGDDQVAAAIADVLVRLATTARDRQQARQVLLGLLNRNVTAWPGPRPEDAIARLAVTARDKREVSRALLQLLPGASADPRKIAVLMRAVVQLAVTTESQRRARKVVLSTLAEAAGWPVIELADGLIQLGPERKDKAQACRAILAVLTSTDDWPLAARLVDALSRLDPGVADLASWRTWEAPPSAELLAAARGNSGLAEWLSALPSLPSPI